MSEQIVKTSKIKLGLSLIWFLFTFSLVVWWWIFSLRQLDLLADVLDPVKFGSMKRMLVGEGAVLVTVVFIGGLGLVLLTYREQNRNITLRNFFANFSHDLKTSLTRLRLRTEVLAEKSSSSELQYLLAEAQRLDLQLENSLWMAKSDSQKLLQEKIQLSTVVSSLRVEWPDLEVVIHKDVKVLADAQALKSVLRNLFQNSWLHGEANKIEIKPQSAGNAWRIDVIDNGKGFKGAAAELGTGLLRSERSTSNGIGLYLTRDLVKRMKGSLNFRNLDKGFAAELTLPAAENS
ncbi:MAG: signal-transducing histidine kinase [Pseudobdellovibrio sp.]|jgi:signal transduction histidine kinase|nr:signal-transducing histidine kinase [Pseudobdellovibrio sp.]